jgi:hypothetical protein
VSGAVTLADVGPWVAVGGGESRTATLPDGFLDCIATLGHFGWVVYHPNSTRVFDDGDETGATGRALADAALARMLGEPGVPVLRVTPREAEALAWSLTSSPPEPAEVPGGATAHGWLADGYCKTEGCFAHENKASAALGCPVSWPSVLDVEAAAPPALSEVSRLRAALAAAEARAERAERALAKAEQFARDAAAEWAAQEAATSYEDRYHNYGGRLAATRIADEIAALRAGGGW